MVSEFINGKDMCTYHPHYMDGNTELLPTIRENIIKRAGSGAEDS